MDMLLATGEQESVALMAMAIQDQGESAVSLTGGQIGIVTDSTHTKARIRRIDTERIRRELDAGKIVVAAGFQGVDNDRNITTLGRGGSDTTATALAAVLGADECEIYTDVEGVFTTDPRLIPAARKTDQISYDEMLELASLGAGVMHSRSIEFAKKYRVPLRVRPAYSTGGGTLIAPPADDTPVVTGMALARNEARVSLCDIPDRPGVMSLIFTKMAARKIPIDMVVQDLGLAGKAEVSFTVPPGRSGRHVDGRPAGGRRTWSRPRPSRNQRVEALGGRPGDADAHGRGGSDVPIAGRCVHQHRHDHDERDQDLRARQSRPV